MMSGPLRTPAGNGMRTQQYRVDERRTATLEHAHRKLAVRGCEGQAQRGGSSLARNAWRAKQDGKYRGGAFGGGLQTPQFGGGGGLGPRQNRAARVGSQRLFGCPQCFLRRARFDEDEPGEIDAGTA